MTAWRNCSAPPKKPAISSTLPWSEMGGTFNTSGMTNCAVPCSAYFSRISLRIGSRFRAVLRRRMSCCSLAHAVGTLTAGAQRRIKGDVAEQVKRISLRLVRGVAQRLKADAAFFEERQ